MSVVVLCSAKGSPGVTTTAVALSHVWPSDRDLVLAELDHAGGDLAARFGLPLRPGLSDLACSPVDAPADELLGATQAFGSLRLLVAPPGSGAATALDRLGERIGRLIAQAAADPRVDVIVDAGRLGPGCVLDHLSRVGPAVVIVTRTVGADVAHVPGHLDGLHQRGVNAGVALIGSRGSTEQVAGLFGTDVWGALPEDRRGAAGLGGQGTPGWLLPRLPLVRAARCLAERLLAGPPADFPAPEVPTAPTEEMASWN